MTYTSDIFHGKINQHFVSYLVFSFSYVVLLSKNSEYWDERQKYNNNFTQNIKNT